MKNLFKPIIAIVVLSLFVAGCKKDKKDAAANNNFNYNGVNYNLAKGFLENYGKTGTEGYNIDLSLLSSEFTIHESMGEIDSVSGVGDAVYFEIYTSLPGKLDIKDYLYDAAGTRADGTFDAGGLMMGYNSSTQTGAALEITGGKVSVTSNGSEYEITFNGTASNGKTFTGYYKGALQYYTYAKKKKSVSEFSAKKIWGL